MLLDGRNLAQETLAELRTKISALNSKRPLRLVAILVGDDPASLVFLRQKKEAAETIGVEFRVERFPMNVSNEKLRRALVGIGRQTLVTGLLVQLPLPEHLNAQAALNAIPPEKDVDVLTERNVGRFALGRLPIDPPPVAGVKKLLAHSHCTLAGKHVVVVGQGRLIGKPIAWWLLNEGATFTTVTNDTPDARLLTQRADILIAGAGKPRAITADMVKEGVVVFDFGSAKEDDRIVGDVDFDAVAPKASSITPVPGGMGPLTVAMIFENLYTLVTRRRQP